MKHETETCGSLGWKGVETLPDVMLSKKCSGPQSNNSFVLP